MAIHRVVGVLGCLVLGLAIVIAPTGADATPGAHPLLVATADTRASSVVLAYHQALGPLTSRVFSYNANFTATSGNFSAQFGAHFLQLQETSDTKELYGAAATGTAVLSIPLSTRFDNGVPRVSLLTYAGAAPNAAVSGRRNFLNVPIGLGLGLPMSPTPWLTVSPWFEVAPGADLDTTISDPNLSQYAPNETDIQQIISGQQAVLFSESDLRNVIAESVHVDLAFEMAMRAGLDVSASLSDSWSVNLNAYLTSLGTAFGGTKFVYLGGGLAYYWDDVVPAVLPPQQRLLRESCEDVEIRFRMCPAWKKMNSSPLTSSPAASVPVATSPSVGGASDPAKTPIGTGAPAGELPPSTSFPEPVKPAAQAPAGDLPSMSFPNMTEPKGEPLAPASHPDPTPAVVPEAPPAPDAPSQAPSGKAQPPPPARADLPTMSSPY